MKKFIIAVGGWILCSMTVCFSQDIITKPKLNNNTPKSGTKSSSSSNRKASDKRKDSYEDIATLKPGEKYSRINKYGSNGLAVVELDRPYGTKYGLIDKDGNVVVPLMYDGLGQNCLNWDKKYVWEERQKWRSVSKRTKDGWKVGYIDASGKLVVPLIYDSFVNQSHEGAVHDSDKLIRVKKNGKWGCLNLEGAEVVPCIYDSIGIHYSFGTPVIAKKDGKYGFIDYPGNIVVPFKYTSAEDYEYPSGRAIVGNNGRYGYIDWLGNEVIPLQYEYAMPFRGGLAGVVKNGKLGFIDRNGKVVIPFEYDISVKSISRKGASYFEHGVVALVEKNSKWGAIDKNNKQVIPFEYDWEGKSGDFGTAYLYSTDSNNQKTVFYMDCYGNLYIVLSHIDYKQTDQILADKGVAEGQYRLGLKAYNSKDYKTAIEWFSKAAKQNHGRALYFLGSMAQGGKGQNASVEKAVKWYEAAINQGDAYAMNQLAYLYYYGKTPSGQADKKRAFGLFNQASDQLQRQSLYFMGWMYERGQCVEKDNNLASRYYLKSSELGYEPATKRLQELNSQAQ